MTWKVFIILPVVVALVSGCTTVPANPLGAKPEDLKGDTAAMKQIMARRDRFIQLSAPETAGAKPVLLLLHGTTDDPTEMSDIIREWRGKYDVYLFAYNYHQRVQAVARHFDAEVRRKKSFGGRPVTVLAYSYGAIVFREAVILADGRTSFTNVSLIQLAPTAGGSFLARGMKHRTTSWLISFFSPQCLAADPYGPFAERLWSGAGNQKFYETIPPSRMLSILVEGDPHSLAGVTDWEVYRRYLNGIGPHVVIIPKSDGVLHQDFPTEPAALACLREWLEPPVQNGPGPAGVNNSAAVPTGVNEPLKAKQLEKEHQGLGMRMGWQ